MFLPAAFVSVLFWGAGCSDLKFPGDSDSLNLERISLSAEMIDPLTGAEKRLSRSDKEFFPQAEILEQYSYFSHAINDLHSSAPMDSFLSIWSHDPQNLLWIDLALRNRRTLKKNPIFDEIISRPSISDTTTAVGCFFMGYKNYRRQSGGWWWQKAEQKRAELAPFQQIWLDRWLAIIDRAELRPDDGVRRLIPLLESAHTMGGPRLEFVLWVSITNCLMGGDHLDDALHTVEIARKLARQLGGPYLETLAEFWLGRVFLARENLEDAGNQFRKAALLSEQNGYNWMHKVSRNQLAKVYDMLGNYSGVLELDRANLALAVATEDSLNIPIILMNIAHAHRALGQLDSCRIVQDEAIRCVRRYPNPTIVARLPMMLAEYYAQVGQYAQMDSLLNVALDNPTNMLVAEETVKLHMELIQGGLRQGRPDLVHRSIVQVDSLRNLALAKGEQIAVNYQDDLLFADFYTQQNEYQMAQTHWQRAKETLADSDSPEARWKLLRSKGLLARQRGDSASALAAFKAGLQAIEGIENPELQAEGSYLLGSALLDEGKFEEALDLFPARGQQSEFGGNFRTRLASQIFRGVTYLRAQEFSTAAVELEKALAMCSEWSPMDLVVRTHLELGRAQFFLGQFPDASEHLHLAWKILLNSRETIESSPGERFHGNLYRETAEAIIHLYLARPETAPDRNTARATLDLYCHLFESGQPGFGSRSGKNWTAGQLVFFMGENESYRWAISENKIQVSILPSAEDLQKLISPVLSDLSHAGRKVSGDSAARLGETLLAGTETAWSPDQTLFLVCDGLLGSVPWAALPLPASYGPGQGNLALDFGTIVYKMRPSNDHDPAPELNRSAPPGQLLAVGANAGSNTRMRKLTHAEEEAEAICSLWQADSCTVLVGEQASWATLKNMNLNSFSVIHLASHARVFKGLPKQSYLVLSGARGQEHFTAGAVADLSLRADLVYLSSCEAATSAGGSVVGGFVQAFLDAGAGSVIASSLEVDDQASRFLAERVYHYWLTGNPIADALRLGQKDLVQESRSWSHPFYWAFYRIYQ